MKIKKTKTDNNQPKHVYNNNMMDLTEENSQKILNKKLKTFKRIDDTYDFIHKQLSKDAKRSKHDHSFNETLSNSSKSFEDDVSLSYDSLLKNADSDANSLNQTLSLGGGLDDSQLGLTKHSIKEDKSSNYQSNHDLCTKSNVLAKSCKYSLFAKSSVSKLANRN